MYTKFAGKMFCSIKNEQSKKRRKSIVISLGQCAARILRLEAKPNKALDQGRQTQSRKTLLPVKHMKRGIFHH